MSQTELSPIPKNKIFQLKTYDGREIINAVVITPFEIEPSTVAAAWSYALRYTAKGLDLPDHDAALELLRKRHPSWQVIEAPVIRISVDLGLAEKDTPENF